MSCCNNNINIRTTGVIFNDTANALTFTVSAGSFSSGKPYNIIFSQSIPTETTVGSTIVINDGTTNYQVYTRKGYTLQTKHIVNKRGLRVWYNGTSFVLRNFIEV